MKLAKSTLMAILAFAAIFIISGTSVIHANEITINIDGHVVEFLDQEPVLQDGYVLVPVRAVFESLGYDVHWSESTQRVILANEEEMIHLTIGDDLMYVNGEETELEKAPQIMGDRTMLPLSDLLETLGYQVAWDEDTMTETITTNLNETITTTSTNLEQTINTTVATVNDFNNTITIASVTTNALVDLNQPVILSTELSTKPQSIPSNSLIIV